MDRQDISLGCPVLVLVSECRGIMNRDIVQKVDQVAMQMEEKYGYNDRLLDLVPQELANKFIKAKEQFDDAIRSNNGQRMQKVGEALIRGYKALDAIAAKSNQSIWKVKHTSGKMLTVYKGPRPRKQEDGSILMSIEELVKFVPGTILTIKETFPKSSVKDKDIPF